MADERTEYVLIPCPHCGSTETQLFVKQTSPASSWWVPAVLVLAGLICAVLLGLVGLVIFIVCVVIAIITAVATRKGTSVETWRCGSCGGSFKKP